MAKPDDLLLAANLSVVTAQSPTRRSAVARNRTISSIVREIDARNIEASIRKLVSFGTRNTLSEQNDPKRGIGAARDWLYAEFLKAAEASKGRMTVEKQSYEQPKAQRIPQPTIITNVVATLKGSQPESTDRIYVVSGHYDSMCNSPTDAKCDAPGANDDASGTAAVLEMARVMAKYEFEATIVFMAVAGEEQSLLGSTYFAEQAKQKNWNIDAMFTNDIIGNTLGGNGVRDRGTVRVFSEGVPSNETPAEANTRRSVGGENDSASRQLARFIKETGEGICAADESDACVPARSIRTWRRSHSVSRTRLSSGALHGSQRRVPASASKRSRREWRAVWRPAGVCGFRVRRQRGASERGFAGSAGIGAFETERSDDSHGAFVKRYGFEVGGEQGTGSGGLRDRLARHNGGDVDQFETGRQCNDALR